MSWLTGIKAALSAPKIVEKGVDGVIAGIDKCFYTDEERSEAKQEAGKTLLKFWELTTQENTEQSKARRVLAKMTFQVYFFLVIMGALVYKFDSSYAKFLFDVAGSMTWLVTMVGAIYFGPHQVSKIWKKDK
jgi:hypothetical protein